jgi:hypothetical protein
MKQILSFLKLLNNNAFVNISGILSSLSTVRFRVNTLYLARFNS